jgi:hypothetical protein
LIDNVQKDSGSAAESVYLSPYAEGRDKLTKFLIYLFKFIDAVRTILRKRPTYRMERIASTPSITQSTSRELASL